MTAVNKKEMKILNLLKKIQDEKDIDKVADMILNIVSLNGMKMDEVAALNFYIMKQALGSPNNKQFIKNHFGFDSSTLGVSGVLDMQHVLIKAYIDRISK